LPWELRCSTDDFAGLGESVLVDGRHLRVDAYAPGDRFRRGEAHVNVTEREGTEERAWPGAIAAITLFVEDLEAAKRFYREVFELPVAFEDDNSAVFRFGETLVNLLKTSEAPSLVEPATVAARDAGVRFQLTLGVEDVDAMCEDLKERGVELLNGPMDRPWGIRTASFRDPGGHIWEIAH
jgi:catechol 2,3-dioxygenase-like lactoylglutathione lyase family enzyme